MARTRYSSSRSGSVSMEMGRSLASPQVKWVLPSGTCFCYSPDEAGGAASASTPIFRHRLLRNSHTEYRGGVTAGLTTHAVGRVEGVRALVSGYGVPMSTLADRTRLICRSTLSLSAHTIPKDTPNLCWRASADYTFDLGEARLVGGGQTMRLSGGRTPAALVLSGQLEHREGGNVTAGGIRLIQQHHVFKPRLVAFGVPVGLDVPVYMDSVEFYGRCRLREGGEFEVALDPHSGGICLRVGMAI